MNGLFFLLCCCFFKGVLQAQLGDREEKCQEPEKNQPLNSFLWTLDRDPPSYLFGTIHVPYTKVWDYIPQNTKTAFRQSEYVFFELDLTDPYTISALANCQLLPKGVSLGDILPRSLYRRLKRHLAYVKNMMPNWVTEDQRGRGLYGDYLFNAIVGNWERKRPIWVMLMVNSLTEHDVRTRGIPVLDLYLAQEAERTGKRTGAVEEVDEQCIPLNRLNFTQVLFALNQTLWHHEHQRQLRATRVTTYSTDDLIKHYNCGDLNTVIFSHDAANIPNLVNDSLPAGDLLAARKIDEYFREELIFRRNMRMARRVMQLVDAYPQKSFFFAFGAGHFLGNNSILYQLQRQGFHIRHTSSTERIPRVRNKSRSRSRRPEIIPGVTGADLPLSKLVNTNRFSLSKLRHDPFAKKRRRKKYRDRGRSYARFSDLWVRLEMTSSTPSTPTTRSPSFYRVYFNPAQTTTFSTGLIVTLPLLLKILI